MIENKYFKKTILGLIPDEWGIDKIGNIFYIKTGKTNVQDSTQDGKYPLFDRSTRLKKSSKYLFDSEAIIVPGEGKEFIPRYFDGKFDLHQRAYALIPKDRNINVKFFYYWIYLDRAYLEKVSVGSTVKSLRLEHFYNFPLPLPSRKEQDSISVILSCLDSKIELNEKMNKTLEAIAQAIFKHWFIDFEFPDEDGKPYKSSGGEMIDSELGKIPKGWTIGTLGDHIVFIKGKKSIELQQNENLKLIPIISMEMLENGECKFGVPMKMKIANKYDPIMVMDGASSGRIEIGFEGIIGSTFASITPNDNILSSFYLFGLLKYLEKVLRENTTGTSIPHADKKRIKKIQFLIPIKQIILKFDDMERAIIDKLSFNRNEVKNLILIRDSLLPKFIEPEY